MPNPITYALLSDLLHSLEQEGFPLGTGQHLKVQELWKRLPDDIEPERLKTLLVPLFATDPQQQKHFYDLFDKSRRRVQSANKVEEEEEKAPTEEERSEKKWRWLVLIAALALTTILIAIFWRTNKVVGPTDAEHRFFLDVVRGDTLVQDPVLRTEEKDTLRQLAFVDGELYAVDSIWGEYEIDSMNQLVVRAGDTIGQAVDTLIVRAIYNTGLDSITYILNLRDIPESPVVEEVEKPEKKAPRLKTREIPYIHDLPIPDQAAIEKAAFWQKNRWWIKGMLVILLALLLGALVQWLERRRKKAVAILQKAHKAPPYVWTIDLEEPEELAVGLQAKQLTSRLRRRQLEDYHKINIPATINATARHAGQIHLRYTQPSKPTEYLLLIDRTAMQDHRALLFDQLYESFKQEEVHIDRFFYDGSPQVVFNEKYPDGLPLKDLQHKYEESRLLIVGDGRAFFNPITGDWAKWTDELAGWKARGLLTPLPLDKWSYDEEMLARKFFLLPASLQGIDRLIEQFELVEPKPWEEMIKQIDDASKESIRMREELLTTLRMYYSEPMVRWIAACAVYPQLQWKLTLHLGKELSSEVDNLLTVDNILHLVRLPWFVEGKMPNPVRASLIDYLKKEGLEKKIRETIKVLLDKAPKPDQDSVAYEKWRVNQLFNQIQIIPPSPQRRELKKELENYIEAGYQPDSVTLDVLEKENAPPGAAQLSDRWKELLFREGDAIFGWKGWIWAVPLWLLLSGLFLWFNPKYEACAGDLAAWNEQEACLESEEDWIIFYDLLSRGLIREQVAIDTTYLPLREAGFVVDMAEVVKDESLNNPFYQQSFASLYLVNEVIRSSFDFENQFDVYQERREYKESQPDKIRFWNLEFSSFWPYYTALFPSRLTGAERRSIIIQPLRDSLQFYNQRQEDDRIRLMGDQYIENLAIAFYNRGAILYNQYLDVVEGIDRFATETADSMLDAAAFNLLLARDLGTGRPEVFTALLRVYDEDQTYNFPASIAGRVLDEDGSPLSDVQVSIDGFEVDALTDENGQYTFDIPVDWEENTLDLRFFRPGFSVEQMTHLLIDETSDQVREVRMTPLPDDQEDQLVIFEDPQNRRQGVRTRSGEVIIPANYGNIDRDEETGYFRVETPSTREGTKFGFYDQRGQIVVPAVYDYLHFYSEGMVQAQEGTKWGYLNISGSKAFPFNFVETYPFEQGKAKVAIRNELSQDTVQFYVGKDGKCVEGAVCLYSDIAETYIRAICDVGNVDTYVGNMLKQSPPEDILAVVNSELLRIFYPKSFLDEAENCVSDIDLYVNDHIFQLSIWAALADRIPQAAQEVVINTLAELEDDPETTSRMNGKLQGTTVDDLVSQIRESLGLLSTRELPYLPIRELNGYKSGEVILSVYFDNNQPLTNPELFFLEQETRYYLNKLSISDVVLSREISSQTRRLNELADKIFNALGSRYGTTLELAVTPIADNNVDRNIARNRLQVVKNYLWNYKDGLLQPYISSGVIQINELPLGEIQGDPTQASASDELYALSAIKERRVEVIFRQRPQYQQIQRPQQQPGNDAQRSGDTDPPQSTDNAEDLVVPDLNIVLKQLESNMVFVQGGEFRMGCTEEQEPFCYDSEKPVREVTVGDFYMSKYEVTNEEFCAFLNDVRGEMERSGSFLRYNDQRIFELEGSLQRIIPYQDGFAIQNGYLRHPVVHVTWYGARAFVEWLNQKTGAQYDLPSEAQWEYAARGGAKGRSTIHAGSDDLDEVGWFSNNSNDQTHEVGQKRANELGLFDMSGNVWEWCLDLWHDNYKDAPLNAIAWIEGGEQGNYVLRGGSWFDDDFNCRVSDRGWSDADLRYSDNGFRVSRY